MDTFMRVLSSLAALPASLLWAACCGLPAVASGSTRLLWPEEWVLWRAAVACSVLLFGRREPQEGVYTSMPRETYMF